MMTERLPIEDVLPDLTAALTANSSVVLKAPPGAGKTTRVPIAILDAGLAGSGDIVVLEPRRIAARSAARRMAFERGERVGATIGYRVRFDDCVSRETRVVVVTEGILLRRLQDDPFLEGTSCVIFDEFHERRLDSDLALAMVRRIQQTVRPELRIVVMSATLDPVPIASFLGVCPVIESEGRQFPVQVQHVPRQDRTPLPDLAAAGVEQILRSTDGHVLVFLPGVGEIQRTRSLLTSLADKCQCDLMPLFGDMPPEEQDRVLAPGARRKIVLATNVAETSVTIEGVTAVVDTGVARQMHFDPAVGIDRLELTPISIASADQRAGRAGRTQPGQCLRLWDEASHRRRLPFETAELHRVDLSSAVLRLMDWGETDLRAFPWYEAPSDDALAHAQQLLTLLGAIRDGTITELGRRMVRLPVAPRLARLLIDAAHRGVLDRAALMVALLSEREPFLRHVPQRSTPGHAVRTVERHRSTSDVLDRLEAVEEFLRSGREQTRFGEIHRGGVRNITRTADQLRRLADSVANAASVEGLLGKAAVTDAGSIGHEEQLLRSLLAGFPDRVARRREATSDKGLMVGGRGVRFGPHTAVTGTPLFLCVDVDGAGSEAVVRQASEVLREWLPDELVNVRDDLFFHPSQKQVVARRRTLFADLVLDETPVAISDELAAAEVLFDFAAPLLDTLLPNEDGVRNYIARLRCLARWMPERSLPACDDDFLKAVLRSLCFGRRSLTDLRSAPWLDAIKSTMDYATQQFVEREAPERIEVPSGNGIRLEYFTDSPPVLAVRIQEIFGLRETPRIAGGRITVVLHLLAPNMRPQQITTDIASFWANTYSEVKKDLKRRYPKHAWPDDPLTAVATRRR